MFQHISNTSISELRGVRTIYLSDKICSIRSGIRLAIWKCVRFHDKRVPEKSSKWYPFLLEEVFFFSFFFSKRDVIRKDRVTFLFHAPSTSCHNQVLG